LLFVGFKTHIDTEQEVGTLRDREREEALSSGSVSCRVILLESGGLRKAGL
jgi:hypothetical protein